MDAIVGMRSLGGNTPLDLVLAESGTPEVLCFAVALLARQGSRPRTLAASASRAGDLALGNQTRRLLEGRQHEFHLRGLLGQFAARLSNELRNDPAVAAILAEGRALRASVAIVVYRGGLEESGMHKPFNFPRAILNSE